MPEVSRSALLMYSADEMFQLVNDIDAYPEFLIGCVGSQIISKQGNALYASIEVAKAGIHKTFTTENTLINGQRISMKLVDGPFEHLSGNWRFLRLDDKACKVNFDLSFEFTSKLVEFTFGRIFNSLVGSMMTSFAARAKVIYGER
ncbi:MAG: SRPBCC family protein [Psychromonas sp.]|nr:SRPBCC family protein [Psychromonas sp.]